MNRHESTYGNVIVFETLDHKFGVKNLNGEEIVPVGKYGWIDGFDHGLARVRTNKPLGRARAITSIINLETGTFIDGKENVEKYLKEDRKAHPDQYTKWGIINEKGEEVLPLVYDEIWNFFGKNRISTKVEKDGITTEVNFHDLNPDIPQPFYHHSTPFIDDYCPNYGEFAGSYAQDVMGYSDDDIYDAFEGDPDMYWNID